MKTTTFIPTHHDLLAFFGLGNACPEPLCQLPGYFRPPSSSRRGLLRIEVFSCSKCDEIIEVLDVRSLMSYPKSRDCTARPRRKPAS